MTKTITKNNSAVVINQNSDGGLYWANLYVNIRNGIRHADITSLRWEGKTLKGAERWAEKQLATA